MRKQEQPCIIETTDTAVDDANAALVPGGVTKYEQEVDKIRGARC